MVSILTESRVLVATAGRATGKDTGVGGVTAISLNSHSSLALEQLVHWSSLEHLYHQSSRCDPLSAVFHPLSQERKTELLREINNLA